ncbi:hypothetical protein EJ04DRAFT_553481 [Polyplosphaeria fusca]|uniref:NACHT domain-containing protein n=1 Tax=Polyplosphaeria fusca TaxID=682080 RepID=A0A9P4QYB2_9PLEO|nr:hypothetical protein EJ04DRAFT_553481 [Polyplosphaeria fusca]
MTMAQPTVVRYINNDLWARAATGLSDNDKRNINFNRRDKLNILAELHATAEQSRQRSIESRWKYTRKNGEVVIIRDVFEKIVRWIDMFKQVGDAAVRYDPANASLPWAGIRFLLQIAVNDMNKHAWLIEDLARIAELICRFAPTEELYLQGTSNAVKELENSVVKLYAHILTFLSTTKQHLEQETEKRTLKSAFLTEKELGSGMSKIRAAEKEVNLRVVLVDRLDNNENHAKLMDILARIDKPLRRMDDGLNNIHDDLQASKRMKIIQWLSPEPYIQHHKQTMQGVLAGTGQWLLSDPLFKKWKDDSASSILWLHGIPGSGKSKMVSVVVEDALARYKAGDSPQPVFFYCSRNPAEPARSQPQAILASLARQLSCLEPGKPLLGPSVNLFKEKEAGGTTSFSLQIDESLSLVLDLIAQYPLTTIVIDAIDECDPRKRHELLKALEKMLQHSSSLVKIFVSSRNDQDIVLRLRHYPNLEIDSWKNSGDIARFVNDRVEQLIQEGRLLQYSKSKTAMKKLIIDKVIEGAAGMFRWASMQLQYLCSFELDDEIRGKLGRLPPDLNTLYDELYGCFRRSRVESKQPFLEMPFTGCYSELGGIVEGVSKELMLNICNNFIVFDPQLDTYRFAHLSVREYLEQRPEYGSAATNALAAEVCLWTVLSASSNIATKTLLLALGWRANTSSTKFEQFCTYADIYWPEHCESAKEQRRSGKLEKMLHHVLMGHRSVDSAIALWNDRLLKHLARYEYWDGKLRLEDTLPGASSESFVGLFLSCAFDFGELIRIEFEDSAKVRDLVNQNGRSPLHVATRNGSCTSLVKLLTLDQPHLEVTQEVMVAAAGNEDNGEEVMALLLDWREDEAEITQEVLVAAAGNSRKGKEVMALLLEQRGYDINITTEVVVAAAGNEDSGRKVMTLLRACSLTALNSDPFAGETLPGTNYGDSVAPKEVLQPNAIDQDGSEKCFSSLASNNEDIGSRIGSKVRTPAEIYAVRLFGNFLGELSELQLLHEKALTVLGKQRFVRNYRRILKIYVLKLVFQSGTRTRVEDLAIRVLKSRQNRRDIARKLVQVLRPDNEDQWRSFDPLNYQPAEKQSIANWIDSTGYLNVQDYQKAHESMANRGHLDQEEHALVIGEDEESDDSEDESDYGADGHDNFDTNLLSVVADASKFLHRDIGTLIRELSLLVLPSSIREVMETVPKEDIHVSSENDASLVNRIKAFVEDNTSIEWDWWPLRPRVPNLQSDVQRLEWEISGHVFYEDITVSEAEAIQGILCQTGSHPLKCYCCTTDVTRNVASKLITDVLGMFHSFVTGTSSAAQQRYTPANATTTGTVSAVAHSIPLTKPISVLNKSTSNIAQAQRGGPSHLSTNSLSVPSWVIFGIRDRFDFNDIENIKMSNLSMNDDAFFTELRRLESKYRWPVLKWVSPYIFSYCKFVQFEMLNVDRVFCGGEHLPEDNGHEARYEYHPRPPHVKNPPITREEFRRYLRTCSTSCRWYSLPFFRHRCFHLHKDSQKWRRIPRRNAEFETKSGQPGEIAYGIEAVYLLSFPTVFVYHLLSLLALLGFWLWWLKQHPDDLQNASVPTMVFLAIVASFWVLPGRGASM